MARHTLRISVSLSLLALASACSTAAPTEERETYVFAYLVSGTEQPASRAEGAELQEGHLANIGRLAEEEVLLVAGPFGDPRPDPRQRGVFIFDVETVEDIEVITATDPMIAADVLAVEAYPFHTSADLRALPAMYREAAHPTPQDSIRAYALAHCTDPDLAALQLADADFVILDGELGGERSGTALYVLDFEDVDAAKDALMALDPDREAGWRVQPWWGAKELPLLRAGG